MKYYNQTRDHREWCEEKAYGEVFEEADDDDF